ncbi:hypothetical protein DH2020_002550 [Rehmannia glutinosa]|uniref:Uncharacterized protein n=1 Tax=Rehmannia glutinosa TaxID=99300 RepID=A0ABR0XU28_REHGL
MVTVPQDLFKKAILHPGPPQDFALQTVQQVIKPQKQVKLVQDENQLLENILRTLLQELVSAAVQSGEEIMQYGQSIADGDIRPGQVPRLLGCSLRLSLQDRDVEVCCQIELKKGHALIRHPSSEFCLLDIVLYLCEKEHVEGGMIFQLLEDLTEMSTMRNCKDIFGYIESKQDILGKPELFARGKLVMLRTCNQLLRRLSKNTTVYLGSIQFCSANDVVFCGRIIMFLAHFFPLSERSAVNIKGVFNTSNETKYEKEAPDYYLVVTYGRSENGTKIGWWPLGFERDHDVDLGKREKHLVHLSPVFSTCFRSKFLDQVDISIFSDVQESFSNPASLTPALTKWHKFTSSLTVVLNTFEAQPLSDEEGSAINLEDEGSNFSIKYLTSSNLMGLELKDPSFRRHVLVQCLILFDYLKAPGKNDKDLPSDTMKEEIKSCEERVKKLLEMTPPRGKEFLHSIEHILERERNWVIVTVYLCPSTLSYFRPRWRLGNKELSQLWKWADQNPNALTDPQRVRTPAIMDYWKPLAEDVSSYSLFFEFELICVHFCLLSDLLGNRSKIQNNIALQLNTAVRGFFALEDNAENLVHKRRYRSVPSVQPAVHLEENELLRMLVQVYCWKGLRFSARQDLEGFSRFTEHGIEGVVPLELLPPDVRSKYQAKPGDRSKRAKKEETKGSVQQVEESQIATTPASETDVEGSRMDPEASVAPADGDAIITSAGQIEVDTEAEQGMIDGEMDAEVDLDVVA